MSKSSDSPIFLIGMPGVGKSYLGNMIADKLSINFIDLDESISKKVQLSIPEFIKRKGVEFFRTQEALALRKININKLALVSCGGGCPCFHGNISYMNHVGHSIFLDLPLELLINRYHKRAMQRPLMVKTPEEYLTQTYQTRISKYSKANHTVSISDNAEQNVDNIISLIKSL